LLFYLVSNKKKISFKKIAIFGAPLLVLVGFVVVNTDLISRLTNFSLTSGTIATRLLLWKIGIQAFFDKWLFGWGPENFTYAFSKFYNPRLLKFSFYETWADKPHNQLIEIATTTGIFGLITFLGIILFSLYALWRLFIKDRTQLFPYLLIGGAIISYFIHIFFAFDTLELRMILFMVLGYIIFLTSRAFNVKGLSFSLIRGFILIVLITAVVSLNIIGIKTIYASYCADEARNSIIDNKYMDIKASFNKLKDIETPYKNGNWEVLADRLLESNAVGRMPKSVMVEILPTIITGLEEAAKEQEENFSYHYRLGQMYHLAGDYIDKKYFDKSVEALEQAKKISPKRQVSDLLLAQIYYSKRDTEKGIKLLEDLIKETPNVAEPYWYLGILYDAGGEYDKSYAYMTTAAEKGYSPKSINEEFLYVTVLGRFNDYYKMAPVYESIIEKDKTNPRWWANIAVVYLELEKYEKARDATRQAMFLDPKFGDEGEGFLRKIDEKEKGEK
ncbi:tetratricopeptide repeat protein, partial [Patescibacteria group bacterium]|nr:tetratricopeptide repeat protein [Patescibacteria group bacterium]